ncbi:TetR/AcrR family transcriptional regulator [Kutzneria kofuensis]|uniref:AcrR family transcriptional regulator n=1 Tax=Kutzneria kofuensis TaxID=103725 RepID=A0A7W9KNP0_9PSEU|nr:TetR/AcrR family transcriptional regulator [Kutzneria kofuensis]MBB5895174.1 AcrR family transcriptional regulator [Kutzneria kofuensis]
MTSSARDRLLLAAGQLLHEARGGNVSTRAICERAGVQAPTLYHHFGSKQGLLDAVVNYGFTQYVEQHTEDTADPVRALRSGWDSHVRYGLEHPGFYVLLYGQIEPTVPCTLTARAEAMLLDRLVEVARQGRLLVPPAEAAREIVAANVGVTLSLIARPEDDRDLGMSARVRDAVLGSLVTDDAAPGDGSVGALAVALSAALGEGGGKLSAAETAMLREWLDRLSG